jgi:hypothetical protein
VEFGFRVPFDKSGFSVGNRTYSAIVPYAGVFLADPKSFDIVRLVVDVDQLPEQLHACDDTTTLDYASVLLNDAQFLLPRRALLRIVNDDRSEFENRTAFSGCHEFLGESKLRFDTPAASQTEAGERSVYQPLSVPAGLDFALALARPIDTKTAAAGDTIIATLTSALADKSNHVLFPRGAVVTGRIVQILRRYGAHSLVVGIRLETIENGGVRQPFLARLATLVITVGYAIPFGGLSFPQNLGSFDQMAQLGGPAVGIVRFEGVSKNFVVQRGLKLQGATAVQQP